MKKNKAAVSLGRRGGAATLKKYGKKKMLEWSKKGADAKRKAVDNSSLTP